MKSALKQYDEPEITNFISMQQAGIPSVHEVITESWGKIAPFWPLQNLIAVNPLQGLEDLPIEQAMREGAAYFQQAELPKPMEAVNRETIKWCQAFFDQGQATIPMPLRRNGLYAAWRQLARFDSQLHGNNAIKREWIEATPVSPEATIAEYLFKLGVSPEHRTLFLTLLLTTLPGWAAHIKYRTEWNGAEPGHPYPVTQADYLAIRLVITYLLWPQASSLLDWHAQAKKATSGKPHPLDAIAQAETDYRLSLVDELAAQAVEPDKESPAPAAQIVFCIDVRSEPFRRALEAKGDYETFGFAGFFGVPVRIENRVTGESYPSCPVLLTPKHRVTESSGCSHEAFLKDQAGYERLTLAKRFYQSVKYTFTTPFALVEALGPASGAWMGLRSLLPGFAMWLKTTLTRSIRPDIPIVPELDDIPFMDQCGYAEGALRMMGLTQNFAPLVVLCGHGSATQNNAYATALDCGACGGRHGASNARILANILNNPQVRDYLASEHIVIADTTRFIAAEHNTTTDEVTLYTHDITDPDSREKLCSLQQDLEAARKANSQWRSSEMGYQGNEEAGASHTALRSADWAQVRPEWGLARNAAFIVAPRAVTRQSNLQGRSFLHSYDWRQDPAGASLTVILTAPMVVAQWINTQYLFSTLDNVAYGSGSKVTGNITGKLGIMQGNASDLMHGLPLQSVFATDTEAYHQPFRLMTVVYAPRRFIDLIISKQPVLQKLFGNGWVTLACIEPEAQQSYFLERDLTWRKAYRTTVLPMSKAAAC